MLIIPIERETVDQLKVGVTVTINGCKRTLSRDGDYLCYHDGEKENRCKILEEVDDGKFIQFFAASHGMQTEDHAIVAPLASFVQTNNDDESIYATLRIDGKEIRLHSTPEADRFLDSIAHLERTDELLGASIWLAQKAAACIRNPERLQFEAVPIKVGQRKVAPYSTPEAEEFIATLNDVHDREYVAAFGHFLNSIAEAMCCRAEAGTHTN